MSTITKCILCQTNAQLTEAHLVMSCRTLTQLREGGGINNWSKNNNLVGMTHDEKLKLYLGDDGVLGHVLRDRGKTILKMRKNYLSEVEEK